MTGMTWLQLWPSCVILILLLTQLSFPFAGLRRWLLAGPHVAAQSDEGPWYVEGPNPSGPYQTPREAAGKLTVGQRVRSLAAEAAECAWCVGAHVTFWSVLIFANGSAWDRVCWWGMLWLAASGTVVVLDAIAES